MQHVPRVAYDPEIDIRNLGHAMKAAYRTAIGTLLLGLAALSAGCIVAAPDEGHYDRDHHRYYHEHVWVDCGDHDDHCR